VQAQLAENKSIDKRVRFDVAKALKLRMENKLTYQEIADQLGVSKQAIYDRLHKVSKLFNDPSIVNAIDSVAVPVMKSVQWTMLAEMLDPDRLKSASLNNIAYSFTQVNNARRLEEGQGIGIDFNVNVIQTLGDKTKDLRTMLESLSSTQDVVPAIEHDIDNGMSTSTNMTKANDINNLDDKASLHNTYYRQSLVSQGAEPAQSQRRRGRPPKAR
jgi:transcriptional regulator with XRE-family HTH domain